MHPINQFTKTQGAAGDRHAKASLTAQLECGARAFDLRPSLESDGRLIMHHGAIGVNETLRAGVREVEVWLAAHPTELVLLYISDCGGSSLSPLPLSSLPVFLRLSKLLS